METIVSGEAFLTNLSTRNPDLDNCLRTGDISLGRVQHEHPGDCFPTCPPVDSVPVCESCLPGRQSSPARYCEEMRPHLITRQDGCEHY